MKNNSVRKCAIVCAHTIVNCVEMYKMRRTFFFMLKNALHSNPYLPTHTYAHEHTIDSTCTLARSLNSTLNLNLISWNRWLLIMMLLRALGVAGGEARSVWAAENAFHWKSVRLEGRRYLQHKRVRTHSAILKIQIHWESESVPSWRRERQINCANKNYYWNVESKFAICMNLNDDAIPRLPPSFISFSFG